MPNNDQDAEDVFLIECPGCDGDGWYTDAEGQAVTCDDCEGEGWV